MLSNIENDPDRCASNHMIDRPDGYLIFNYNYNKWPVSDKPVSLSEFSALGLVDLRDVARSHRFAFTAHIRLDGIPDSQRISNSI
jgi:hypothetical protein